MEVLALPFNKVFYFHGFFRYLCFLLFLILFLFMSLFFFFNFDFLFMIITVHSPSCLIIISFTLNLKPLISLELKKGV